MLLIFPRAREQFPPPPLFRLRQKKKAGIFFFLFLWGSPPLFLPFLFPPQVENNLSPSESIFMLFLSLSKSQSSSPPPPPPPPPLLSWGDLVAFSLPFPHLRQFRFQLSPLFLFPGGKNRDPPPPPPSSPSPAETQ